MEIKSYYILSIHLNLLLRSSYEEKIGNFYDFVHVVDNSM